MQLAPEVHVSAFGRCIREDGRIVGQLMEHLIRNCLKILLEPEGIEVRNEMETRHYFEALRDECVDGRMEASLWKTDISFFFRVYQTYIQIKWSDSPEVGEMQQFITHFKACSVLIAACKPGISALHNRILPIWICKTAGPRIQALAAENNIKIITGPIEPVKFASHVVGQLADLLLISRADDRCRTCEYIIHTFNNSLQGTI